MFDLTANSLAWTSHVQTKLNLTQTQLEALQAQLSDAVSSLTESGLTPEEAFLIAIKRVSKANNYVFLNASETEVWKQVQIKGSETKAQTNRFKSVLLVIVFSLIAGTLSKIPEWFFKPADGWSAAYEMMIFKNITLWVLPLVALYLLIQHKSSRKMILTLMGLFALSFVLINVYPFVGERQTELLSGLHAPLLMWLITGVAYLGSDWKLVKRRMDFIRFTGEAFIYGVLIYSGLGVLILFIFLIFSSINVDPSEFVTKVLLPYGAYGTVLVTIYQVEKKNLMENFAPILAKIFSPLFLIAMVVFLLTIVITGRNPLVDRNYLIAFDAMLILVLALVLYVLSSRKEGEPVNVFDMLSLALIVTALIIDGIALFQILSRLFSMGITPNKMAALGENLLVMGNLGGLAFFYTQIMRKKAKFDALEKYQTDYLWLYAGWLAVVAFVFPLLFGFM